MCTCGAPLPRESAELAKLVPTCRAVPSRKCRISRVLQRVYSEQPCPDPAQATDKATGHSTHTLGSPIQIIRERKCAHTRRPHLELTPSGQVAHQALTHTCLDYKQPTKNIWHTVYTKAIFFARLEEIATLSNSSEHTQKSNKMGR